jgi:hypothetical protein
LSVLAASRSIVPTYHSEGAEEISIKSLLPVRSICISEALDGCDDTMIYDNAVDLSICRHGLYCDLMCDLVVC